MIFPETTILSIDWSIVWWSNFALFCCIVKQSVLVRLLCLVQNVGAHKGQQTGKVGFILMPRWYSACLLLSYCGDNTGEIKSWQRLGKTGNFCSNHKWDSFCKRLFKKCTVFSIIGVKGAYMEKCSLLILFEKSQRFEYLNLLTGTQFEDRVKNSGCSKFVFVSSVRNQSYPLLQ